MRTLLLAAALFTSGQPLEGAGFTKVTVPSGDRFYLVNKIEFV